MVLHANKFRVLYKCSRKCRTYINRFPDYDTYLQYAKLVSGIHQSGETQYSRADKKGSRMLNWIIVQCIHTHGIYCNSSVTKHYNKIKSRKETKVATIAAARKMMRVICVMQKEDRSFRPDG